MNAVRLYHLRGLDALAGAPGPVDAVPVQVVAQPMPWWQAVAIVTGAAASVATLAMFYLTTTRRLK